MSQQSGILSGADFNIFLSLKRKKKKETFDKLWDILPAWKGNTANSNFFRVQILNFRGHEWALPQSVVKNKLS